MASERKPLFEHETCSRCGGSGHYSYCQMHGTTCFKCSGSGWQLTKRGHAAQLFYTGLNTRKASEIKLGDVIRVEMFAPGMSRAYGVRIDNAYTRLNAGSSLKDGVWVSYNSLVLEGQIVGKDATEANRYGVHTFPDSPTRLVPTKDEIATRRAEALAYQETLTKAGKPAKRRAA